MEERELYELFLKKESGIISESEAKLLAQILESPEKREIYYGLQQLIRMEKKEISFDINRGKNLVVQGIKKHEPHFSMGEKKHRRVADLNKWVIRFAAVFLVAIGIGSIYLMLNNKFINEANYYQVVTTDPGQNLTVSLEDGSTIVLNGSSTLRYAKNFSKTKREVWMEGGAYCSIAKDEKHPFIVHAGSYSVKVLGTTFNIGAYEEDKYFTVALIEGKVDIFRSRKESIRLSPGKMLSFEKTTDEFTLSTFSQDEIAGWKSKIFIFRNTPLMEVFKNLERRYGINFDLNAVDISKLYINATFKNDSIDSILKTIEFGTDLILKRVGEKQIIITRNN